MMKTNCTWKEVYAIYNTLLPYEKSYLGNHFIDSPNTVFRWIVKRNNENAGFIMLYDMEKPGSHKKELIVTVAIWEKYRGMGGLQELQDAIEQFVSSSSKYNRLIWYAKDANKKSIHCAEKLGYTKKFHELDHWVFDKTIKNKKSLESNSNELNIDISLTDYKTCKSIYEQLSKKDKIAINAYGTSTVFSDGDEVVKRYCCTIDTVPVGFMEYSRYNDGYTYISIVILSKYRGKPYNIANRFITLAKMDNTNIRYVANKKNLASQKFIEKHPEFKLADKTRDCYVYEYQKSKSNNNDKELMIEAFNKELNTADYGILINGKVYTGKNIDWRKYKTISPKDFEKYFAGTCWDFAEYEAKQFEEVFGFKHTLNDLKEKEYSMYYMQIEDNNMCPSHTWIVYKLNGKIYLFESSWMKYQGITEYNTEEEMVKDYIKKHRKESHDKGNPIIVTKYKPNEKFGLTPEEFMRRCIDQGKVIYSEINSIPVQESKNMPMVFSEDDVYCNMSKFRNPCNIIFVCGTSGSGKSTLSKHLSNIYNATYVSLDHIMFWLNRKPRTDMDIRLFDPTLYEYYTENAIPFDELVKLCNSKNDEKFFDYAKSRILDYIEWLSKQDEQFIVEGIQTSWVYDKDKFIVYPFVFKGTSMIKSWIRRAIREKDFFYRFDLKIALKWTSEWKRDVDRIRNAVMLKTTDIYTQKEVYINNGDR